MRAPAVAVAEAAAGAAAASGTVDSSAGLVARAFRPHPTVFFPPLSPPPYELFQRVSAETLRSHACFFLRY